MKVGLFINTQFPEGFNLAERVPEMVAQVRAARDAGFASLWLSDKDGHWGLPSQPWSSPIRASIPRERHRMGVPAETYGRRPHRYGSGIEQPSPQTARCN